MNILTDCDGVLVNWLASFDNWMHNNGYQLSEFPDQHYDMHLRYNDLTKEDSKKLVRIFNNSYDISNLEPFRDAVKYVTKLHEEGYTFTVITSLSDYPRAKVMRSFNLKALFGPAIKDLICLDTGADKTEALSKYKDSGLFWIEDLVKNADIGLKLGLKPILMEHDHNADNQDLEYPKVKSWAEIYRIIKTK